MKLIALLIVSFAFLASCASSSQEMAGNAMLLVDETAQALLDERAIENGCTNNVATIGTNVSMRCVYPIFDSLVEKYPQGGDSISCRVVFRVENNGSNLLIGYIDGRIVEVSGRKRRVFIFDGVPAFSKTLYDSCGQSL